MSDANDFASGIAALLTGDATFVAAIAALLGAPVTTVLRGNIPVSQIPAGSYPCFVVEQGDGKAAPTANTMDSQTIGLAMSSFESDVLVSLIWTDQNPATAAITRGKLPTPFAQLLMRNPQPGGIDGAWLGEWQPDRGVNHPTQIWRGVIAGNYTITKT
ncbi:MAG: hypothetical protein P4L92_23055 [Rudaea sp.]|nr:hypothetical protein [Rudaea sp.]